MPPASSKARYSNCVILVGWFGILDFRRITKLGATVSGQKIDIKQSGISLLYKTWKALRFMQMLSFVLFGLSFLLYLASNVASAFTKSTSSFSPEGWRFRLLCAWGALVTSGYLILQGILFITTGIAWLILTIDRPTEVYIPLYMIITEGIHLLCVLIAWSIQILGYAGHLPPVKYKHKLQQVLRIPKDIFCMPNEGERQSMLTHEEDIDSLFSEKSLLAHEEDIYSLFSEKNST